MPRFTIPQRNDYPLQPRSKQPRMHASYLLRQEVEPPQLFRQRLEQPARQLLQASLAELLVLDTLRGPSEVFLLFFDLSDLLIVSSLDGCCEPPVSVRAALDVFAPLEFNFEFGADRVFS